MARRRAPTAAALAALAAVVALTALAALAALPRAGAEECGFGPLIKND